MNLGVVVEEAGDVGAREERLHKRLSHESVVDRRKHRHRCSPVLQGSLQRVALHSRVYQLSDVLQTGVKHTEYTYA